ncbi:STAS domain-containing protein [candidate division KSB1 bacterium]|nr:STAS domain-containing protein [candidate division KSB1 bacterium]
MEGIQLSVEKAGIGNGISVIKVGGYIDTTTSSELEHALSTLLKQGSYHIVIDLGNVDYVSSAGWGIFISEIKGIREKGGDLKLVRMIPEVYEVFELLEFHYILKAFDTLEDAIRDFERNMGTSTKPSSAKEVQLETSVDSRPDRIKNETTTTAVSIEDRIRQIVAKNPEAGTSQIAKILNTAEYGHVKIGWFGLRKILKNMGLSSKKNRYQLARRG